MGDKKSLIWWCIWKSHVINICTIIHILFSDNKIPRKKKNEYNMIIQTLGYFFYYNHNLHLDQTFSIIRSKINISIHFIVCQNITDFEQSSSKNDIISPTEVFIKMYFAFFQHESLCSPYSSFYFHLCYYALSPYLPQQNDFFLSDNS